MKHLTSFLARSRCIFVFADVLASIYFIIQREVVTLSRYISFIVFGVALLSLQETGQPSSMEKDTTLESQINDHDILGEKVGTSHDEATHIGQLNEEELAQEKKLRRKIDLLIMPMVVLVYLMNYIDRNNYAAARLQGLEEDLNLTPSQYQTGLSILFVGYIIAQVPSNLVLNHLGKPSWYLGCFTILWGTVSALTSLVSNFGQIVACRFILGLVEAPFFRRFRSTP